MFDYENGYINFEALEKQGITREMLETFQKEVIEKEHKINTPIGSAYMLFRFAKLPAITITDQRLLPAYSHRELAENLIMSIYQSDGHIIKVIDNEGYEFHFEIDRHFLIPDWFNKRWTKKDLIKLHNDLCKNEKNHYKPKKKLNYLRLRDITFYICGLLALNKN